MRTAKTQMLIDTWSSISTSALSRLKPSVHIAMSLSLLLLDRLLRIAHRQGQPGTHSPPMRRWPPRLSGMAHSLVGKGNGENY